MTRRDFELFARVIRLEVDAAKHARANGAGHYPMLAQESIDTARRIANSMVPIFEASNPRFDESRFLKACGLTD